MIQIQMKIIDFFKNKDLLHAVTALQNHKVSLILNETTMRTTFKLLNQKTWKHQKKPKIT